MNMTPGIQRANHKYIARVNIGNGYRYFYTQQDIAAYKAQKTKTKGEANVKSKTKKGIARAVPMKKGSYKMGGGGGGATYNPYGPKPAGMSNERWALLQRAWAVSAPQQPLMKSKSKIISRSKNRNRNSQTYKIVRTISR